MKYILLLVFSLISSIVFGQNREEKEGDYYFELFQYYEAALAYKKAYDKDDSNLEVAYKLAESYRNYYNYTNAAL